MKICFVVNQFPSLSETFVLDQIAGCVERGMEVSVLCNEDLFRRGAAAGPIPSQALAGRIARWWGPLGRFRPQLRRWLGPVWDKSSTLLDVLDAGKLRGFDVIVAHFGANGLRVARAMKRRRLAAPLVTIFHGSDVAIPIRDGSLSRYRVLFEQGALQLPVNGYFRDRLVEVGAPPASISVHHMGVRPAELPFRSRSWAEEPVAFISVCRLTEKKGIEYALRALAQLPRTDWRYDIIGGGELQAGLSALARELGVADRVAFLGPRPHAEVKQRLAGAHVFVLPSVTAADGDMEGIPVALMEAMASGLVVASTLHSGIPELIEHGRTGFLAPERDVPALAANLAWILDHPAECAVIAQAARQKVEADFNADRLNDQFAERLRQLAERADRR